jgi:hypothetical protein
MIQWLELSFIHLFHFFLSMRGAAWRCGKEDATVHPEGRQAGGAGALGSSDNINFVL